MIYWLFMSNALKHIASNIIAAINRRYMCCIRSNLNNIARTLIIRKIKFLNSITNKIGKIVKVVFRFVYNCSCKCKKEK